MQVAIKELEKIVELLQLEKRIDLEQFKQKVQQLSLHERKEKGYTWYPLEVVKSGYTYGERAFIILSRNTKEATYNHFRAGQSINFFTQQASVRKPEYTGVINFVNKHKIKIILNAKDLPEWLGGGLLGIDLLFDDRSYLEMEKAMKKVIETKNGRLVDLRNILLGKQEARFFPSETPIQIPHLNPSQNEAINTVTSAQDVAIIHGPPGTGKTTTIVQAIKILSQRENTVLVCAPSNAAVDLLTSRLAVAGLNVVRIGNISRVDEDTIRHTLESKLSHHPEAKNIKKVKIQAADCRRKAMRYKRNFGYEERQERNALFKQAGELSAWANQLEDRLIEQLLYGANVITCTLVGAAHKVLSKMQFRTVFIDEAAQALEPATWIPITKASKVVLTGDPFQLPPTVKSREAQKGGFNITLLEKSLERQDNICLLNVQYRMHELIMGFSNQYFYQDALQADETVKDHQLAFEASNPLVYIDTAGCGFDEKIIPEYKSKYNDGEYNILREHLIQLLSPYLEKEISLPSIAIISPYKEQITYIKEQLEEDEILSTIPIRVDTIDGFQGQERDVVYISMVRSNTKGEIGFLKDYRRMNVAMTRAKKKLVIIGDSATLGNDSFYAQFMAYVEAKGNYQSAWEYMM